MVGITYEFIHYYYIELDKSTNGRFSQTKSIMATQSEHTTTSPEQNIQEIEIIEKTASLDAVSM